MNKGTRVTLKNPNPQEFVEVEAGTGNKITRKVWTILFTGQRDLAWKINGSATIQSVAYRQKSLDGGPSEFVKVDNFIPKDVWSFDVSIMSRRGSELDSLVPECDEALLALISENDLLPRTMRNITLAPRIRGPQEKERDGQMVLMGVHNWFFNVQMSAQVPICNTATKETAPWNTLSPTCLQKFYIKNMMVTPSYATVTEHNNSGVGTVTIHYKMEWVSGCEETNVADVDGMSSSVARYSAMTDNDFETLFNGNVAKEPVSTQETPSKKRARN